MGSVFASSVVDRGFEPRSSQTKDYAFGMCCFSAKHDASLRRKSKDGWIVSRISCPSGATCLPAECCFSALAQSKFNSACWSGIKLTLSSSHWTLTCSRHDILNNCWIEYTPIHLVVSVLLIFSVVCFCFVYLRSCLVPNVADVAGLSTKMKISAGIQRKPWQQIQNRKYIIAQYGTFRLGMYVID